MLILLELFLILILVVVVRRILISNFRRNMAALLMITLALLAANFCFFLGSSLISWISDNIILQFCFGTLGATGSYFWVRLFLKHRFETRPNQEEQPAAAADTAGPAKKNLFDRVLNLGLILLFLGSMFFLVDFMVNLAGISPSRKIIENQTFLLKHLLMPLTPTETSTATRHAKSDDNLSDIMAEQNRFFSNLKKGVNRSRSFVAKSTGSDKMLKTIQTLQEIIALSDQEKQWLIQKNPALKELANHPSLVEIVQSDRIIGLMQDLSSGSVSALYQLGDESAIQALFKDKRIMNAVKKLNIATLKKEVDVNRKKSGLLLTDWQISSIGWTTELDTQLRDPQQWQELKTPSGVINWEKRVTYALARTTLISKADIPVEMRCETKGKVTCWLSGKAVTLTAGSSGCQSSFSLKEGKCSLVLMIDFRNTPLPHQCRVELIYSTN